VTADDFEDAIPLPIVEALFDIHGSGQFAVYTDIMEEFPPVPVPPDFTVCGSANQTTWLRVALATALDETAALAAMREALKADGWIALPPREPPVRDAGFVTGLPVVVRNNAYCHDDHGQVTLSFRRRWPENFLVLTASLNQVGGQSCAEVIAQYEHTRALMSRADSGAQQYMPRLIVPRLTGRSMRQAGWIPGSISSSGHSAESQASLAIAWPLEEVFDHFASQLAEQDWAVDSRSVGSVSATGTWTRTVENDRTVIATLSIVRAGKARYQLRVGVEGPGGRGAAGVIIRN